jgi:C4-dicarboxylate-specific signal transduction histidine kinase
MHGAPNMKEISLAFVSPKLLIDRLGLRRSLLAAAMMLVAVAIADYVTGYAMRLSILYLIPIAIAAWAGGPSIGIATAVSASLLWLFSFKTTHFYLHQGYYYWEAVVMFCGFLAVAWSIARLRIALSQADERFFRVLEEMSAAVYVSDERRDEIIYANPQMIRIAGNPAAVTPSAFEREFLRAPGTAAAQPAQGKFSSRTFKNPRTGKWYLMQAGTIPWGTNPHVKLRVLTDITEQKEAELLREKHMQAMHRAAQLTTLAEIASTLAHEINQPLMAIATYTDACRRLLEQPDCNHDEVSRALDKCHAQAVRAASIIESLREFIRQRQYRPVRCNARSLVSDAMDSLQPLLDEAHVAVDVSRTPSGLAVFADKVLLVQALINLMRNAIEAMRATPPEARKLTIAVEEHEPGEIVFSVQDSGPGLDGATIEKIFEPFFTTKTDGLGLGLAICRSVAEAHGGKIQAGNGTEGGAVFSLSIPSRNVDGQPE